jgi:response regulator RpfG family c-di-GMP phosphodiesterase
VALADVFDALSSRRVYKDSWKEEEVLAEIAKQKGSQFDPEIVEAFFGAINSVRSVVGQYPD